MKAAGFSRPGNLAGPDIQAAGLLAVQLQFLKALLYPLPVLHLVLFGERRDGRMLLGVTLEHARTDEVGGIGHGMHQRLGVVDDEPPSLDALLEPGDEMLAGRLRAAKGFRRPLRRTGVGVRGLYGGRYRRGAVV